MSESETETVKGGHQEIYDSISRSLINLDERIIDLERGLEAVLRRMEASGQADDEPGWYGRPE
jgi:hypothetical protein